MFGRGLRALTQPLLGLLSIDLDERRLHARVVLADGLDRAMISSGIAGVKQVKALGDSRFRIDPADATDPREAIAEAAARGNWGLYELSAHTHTLEEVFVELTSGDEARNAA